MNNIDSAQATLAYQQTRSAPMLPKGDSMKKMQETAQDFEAFFLSQALQPMFANIEPASPFGGGTGDEIWRSMQVDEYGKALAKNGGIGIADAVMKQLLLQQENQQRMLQGEM